MKIRQLTSTLILFFILSFDQAWAQTASAIQGIWYNTEKTAQVEILKSGSEYIGKIVWLKEPIRDGEKAKDVNNPKSELKSRELMGLPILTGLKYSSGMWKGGEIYDPKSGNTYSCEIKMKSPNTLEVKGYLGFSFIGKTVQWTKVK